MLVLFSLLPEIILDMLVICFAPVPDLDEDFTDLADVTTSVCLEELVEPTVEIFRVALC